MIFTNIEPVGKFVKGEFFRIMFIQIGTDFLKFREGTVGMSVSIFFFLPTGSILVNIICHVNLEKALVSPWETT